MTGYGTEPSLQTPAPDSQHRYLRCRIAGDVAKYTQDKILSNPKQPRRTVRKNNVYYPTKINRTNKKISFAGQSLVMTLLACL